MRPGLLGRDVSKRDVSSSLGTEYNPDSHSPKKPRARPGWSCAVNSDDMLARPIKRGECRLLYARVPSMGYLSDQSMAVNRHAGVGCLSNRGCLGGSGQVLYHVEAEG